MRTIHKLKISEAWNHLTAGNGHEYQLPLGARVVLAEEQNGEPHVWYEFDPREGGTLSVRFLVVPTGHVVTMGWRHLSSYVTPPYVWHIYQKGLS